MLIQDYLRSGIIDIEYLLELAISKNKTWIWSNPDYSITKAEQNKLEKLIKKRESGTPFAYLKGEKSFYHLDFIVNEHTLIPRPETENIIEIVKGLNLKNAKVLDLGTGSGIIAITLKSLYPDLEIFAVDNNPNALKVAQQNAKKHNTTIEFILSNWFENIADSDFDIIISNPPYISENDIHLNNLQDPIYSLVAKENGLADIRSIVRETPKYLNKNGYLLLEHGYNQRNDIKKLLTLWSSVEIFNDIYNNHRNILAKL